MQHKGSSLVTVSLLILFLCVANTTQNGRHKRQIFPDQPRILTQNGHLVFQSGANGNITFRSGAGGGIFIDNLDLKNTAHQLMIQVKANKEALDNLHGGTSGNVPQGSIVQRVTTLENQARAIPTLTSNVSSLSTAFYHYRTQIMTTTTGLNTRLSRLENQQNGGASVTTMTQLTQMSNQIQRLNSLVDDLQDTINQRRDSVDQQLRTLRDTVDNLQRLLDVNECTSNPCLNGATCQDLFNGYFCQCPPNWKGARCDLDVNECSEYAGTDLGCQNGATCINTAGGFRCQCATNWHGIHCSERHDDCSGASHYELCGHGTCVNVNRVQPGQARYRCICQNGWTTDGSDPACNVDVNECATGHHCSIDPPVLCINIPGSFVCGSCPAGYTGNGYACSDINECLTNNGGCSTNPYVNCVNSRGSSTCERCPPGYSGDGRTCDVNEGGVCATNNGNCHPMASCNDSPNVFQRCTCPSGYVGSGIGPSGCQPQPGNGTCSPNPCQNGGTCHSTSSGSHYCSCALGFTGHNCEIPFNPCASSPCQNGGRCELDSAVGFRCQCPAQYNGRLCEQEESGCGGRLNAESGVLSFPPSSGTDYDHNLVCAWVIITTDTKVVNLHFERFNLELDSDCGYDSLQINDGPSSESEEIGRYCGSSLPNGGLISSTGNSIYLLFVTDSSVSRDGFTMRWNSSAQGCGGNLVGSNNGTLSSPGYPGNYDNNLDCIWTIQVPFGNVILLTFSSLAIETHPNCSYDYLEIRDGRAADSPLLDRFCSSETPGPAYTTGPYAHIHFHTDYAATDTGFQISYSTPTDANGCGGVLSGESGTFTSPGYPTQYDHHLNCVWSITVPTGLTVTLQFIHFDLEEGSHTCSFDNLEVYDSENRELGRFCGSTLPAIIHAQTNMIRVVLNTDYSVTGDGFSATWSTGCGSVFTTPTGQVQSPNYPENYPASLTCIYTIIAPDQQRIRFDVNAFDLGFEGTDGGVCTGDYVEFINGEAASQDAISRACNSNRPDTIRSTASTMTIRFVSDSSNTYSGFQGSYAFEDASSDLLCGGVFTMNRGEIQSPGFPNIYPSGINCTWFINFDPGFIIKLQFNFLQLAARGSSGCVDFVDVYDNSTIVTTNRLGRFCGSIVPGVLTSSDNAMVINMQTGTFGGYQGFSATYSVVNVSNACGQELTESTGVITSPNYPNNYPHGRDCTWVITSTRTNIQVSLHFTDFNLEPSSSCVFDYLEIRDGGSAGSPVLRRLCGLQERIPPIVGSSNSLFIHFHSDRGVIRRGFRLEYDTTSRGCGSTMTSPTGTITSPNYPNGYHHNAVCIWTISVSEGSVIDIMFEDFDLEGDSTCPYDYFQIREENEGGRIIQIDGRDRICQTRTIGAIRSSTNKVWIKFYTDFSVNGRGFALHYAQNCTNHLTDLHGIIESPNFPHPYSHETNCTWIIDAPASNKINISFAAFDLEGHWSANCSYDFLQIRNGDRSNSPVLQTLCGNVIPPPFQSPSNKLYIKFKSDYSVAPNGFRLEYIFDGCGGIITKNSGSLTSPNYPQPYQNRMECIWRITVDLDKSVQLTIQDLDLERSQGCSYDTLEIFAGPDVNSPRLSQICHTQSTSQVITANGNTMVVRLKTDYFVNGRGFSASFVGKDGGCGGNFSSAQGVIHSPGYPDSPGVGVCEWLITVVPHSSVILNFTDFSIYGYGSCLSDSQKLQIYDGANTSSPLLATLCGTSLPDPIRSVQGNQLFLKLNIRSHNHDEFRFKGFSLNYTTGCGGRIRAENNPVITSPGYPYQTLFFPMCEWHITTANVANRISVTFTHMDIFSYDNCNDSYVTVGLEGQFENYYCGQTIPPIIFSYGSELYIRYKPSRDSSSGFRAVISDSSSACGGEFMAESGQFNSPGYPDDYPNNRECVWQIRTSPGNSLRLSFLNFNMNSGSDVNTDYVEIKSPDVNGELLGRYTDLNGPVNLTVLEGAWIKFRSDDLYQGPGFRAEWNSAYGGHLHGNTGQIASPRYPMLYPSYADYEWTILVDSNQVIKLTFLEFRLESEISGSCLDYLQIFDGSREFDNAIGMYCDSSSPGTLYTTTNTATLVFITDSSVQKTGFLVNWTAVANPDLPGPTDITPTGGCGGDLYVTDVDQILTSPGNLTGYNDNLDCTWQLVSEEGTAVVINITFINLERHSSCLFDYLTFEDGLSTFPKYCGRIRNDEPIRILTNRGHVKFVTDGSISYAGFQLTYRTDCGGIYTTFTTAQIASPGFPSNYPSNANCSWYVNVRDGKTITMDFNPTFSIADSGTCENDYLMLLNGPDAGAPPLYINTSSIQDNTNGHYCGNSPPQSLETNSNSLFVNFISDESGAAQGFAFNFTEKSVACGGHIRLTQSSPLQYIMSPNYPGGYPHNTECVWIIIGVAHERIQVDFEGGFLIESHENCQFDYIAFRDGGTSYSPLLGRPVCGSQLPSTVVSTGSVLYVRFSSDHSVSSTGFKARLSLATCGGRIVGMSGEVTSPNYPRSYRVNQDCEWYLTVPPGHYMTIRREAFQLQFSENCSSADIVEIREGNSTGFLLGSGCGIGNGIPRTVRTGDNVAFIRFHSDSNTVESGFKFSFNASTDVCGGDLTTPDGFITSPNYPRVYADRRICLWNIRVQEGRRITLNFDDFDLEYHPHCAYDFLAVYNGAQSGSPLISRHCGTTSPAPVQSSGNSMRVYFRSDVGVRGRGFSLSYNSNQEAYCGGVITDLSGNITSPGFGQQQYNHSVQCIWRIHNSDGSNSSIVLQFKNLSLEYGEGNCRFDSVTIREGITEQLSHDENSPMIGTYCGSRVPPEYIYVPTPDVYVVFRTDVSVTGDGFKLDYKISQCGGILTQPGVITSPNYPSDYDHNDHCVWKIVAPEGSKVRVHFTDFHFENHTLCGFDFVEIFNGGLPNSPSFGKKCGLTAQSDFESQSNVIKVVMETDYSLSAKGFRMEYSFVTGGCGGHYHSSTGNLASPNYPSSYPHNIECRWHITVPMGYIVKMTFTSPFDLEAASCWYDYVEVMNSLPNGTLNSLGKWCSNEPPPVLVSSGTQMVVVFRTDSTTNGNGFTASWQAVCGGSFVKQTGVVYSPGYPQHYENNMSCDYSIVAPANSLLSISFRDFELEAGESCRFDNVTIQQQGALGLGGRLGTFCGRTLPDRIFTSDGVLITFKSDASSTYKGFKLFYHYQECGGVLTSPHGSISSGFYGADYLHNMNCSWSITVAENMIIAFKFSRFELEGSRCQYDYIAVYDGATESSPLIGAFCGDTVPALIRSTGNQLFARFITDSSLAYGGFRGHYWSTFGPNHGCGGRIMQSSGSLTSFDYDNDGFYEDKLHCTWTITTNLNQILNFNITGMDIESGINCRFDSLSIYDGPSTDSPLVGKYCGTQIPPLIQSSSNILLVSFLTDYSVVRRGFNATFTTSPSLCGGSYNVTTEPQVITSIGYPAIYPSAVRCSWILDAGHYSTVRVNITDLQMASSSTCQDEYLQVRDIPMVTGGQDVHYCGSTLPQPFDSIGNRMQIIYQVNQGATGRGFQLNYQIADCNKMYRGGSGRIVSPAYPNNYPRSIDCILTVTAPVGTSLSLYFYMFEIERHQSCDYDYLEVTNSSSSAVARLCGIYVPDPIFLMDNRATLHFLTDASQQHKGFDITFVASDHGPGCGGIISGVPIGAITSPNYPSFSNITQTCTWTITPPARRSLYFTMTRLTLPVNGADLDCSYNRVTIYKGASTNGGQFLGAYCTETNPSDFNWNHDGAVTINYSNNGISATAPPPAFRIQFQITPGSS